MRAHEGSAAEEEMRNGRSVEEWRIRVRSFFLGIAQVDGPVCLQFAFNGSWRIPGNLAMTGAPGTRLSGHARHERESKGVARIPGRGGWYPPCTRIRPKSETWSPKSPDTRINSPAVPPWHRPLKRRRRVPPEQRGQKLEWPPRRDDWVLVGGQSDPLYNTLVDVTVYRSGEKNAP